MNKELVQMFKQELAGLNYIDIVSTVPDFWQHSRVPTHPFPQYTSNRLPSETLPIEQVHFMQNSIHTHFHDHRYGIISDAKAIKEGNLRIKRLPEISVWQDQQGKIWTLSHRRLATFILSGVITHVPIHWASLDKVNQYEYEYTTKNSGKKIYASLNDELALLIAHSE